MSHLPPPRQIQPYCTVSALEGGSLDLYLHLFVANSNSSDYVTAPSLAFILHHSVSKQHLLFDLGIRKNLDSFHSNIQERLTNFPGVIINQDVAESLEKGGLSPAGIKTICISHCHWDHIGDAHMFPNATIFLGSESAYLFPGYPEDKKSLFSKDWFPWDRVKYLSSDDWFPLGPFPRAFDFYGDGSLYLIDAPGHLQGHTNLLARTSSDGAWIYLAGDSAHHWSLIKDQDAQIQSSVDEHGHHRCMHVDKAQAVEHINRIRSLMEINRVRVLLAHDEPWYKENKGGSAFWPGSIPSL